MNTPAPSMTTEELRIVCPHCNEFHIYLHKSRLSSPSPPVDALKLAIQIVLDNHQNAHSDDALNVLGIVECQLRELDHITANSTAAQEMPKLDFVQEAVTKFAADFRAKAEEVVGAVAMKARHYANARQSLMDQRDELLDENMKLRVELRALTKREDERW